MPFLTGLTYQNIIDREPAVSAYIPDYTTTIQSRIDEAKAVIDNRLRAMGYDLDKIGLKNYFYNLDNEDEGTDILEKTISDVKPSQTLLIFADMTVNPPQGIYLLDNSRNEYYSSPVPPSSMFGLLIPFLVTPDINIKLYGSSTFAKNSLIVYLTDPALYMVHLYKSLELIFEGMRAEPGDIFEQKSIRYNDLYEAEFNGLVTYYDRNGDGTTNEEDGQKPIKQGRLMR